MSPRSLSLIILTLLGVNAGWAAALTNQGNADSTTDETQAAISVYDEDDDFESNYISDFELADAPDPDLKKFKDPEYLKNEYKRGRMAFLFGQYETAYKILMPLAEQGHSKSQATIGWMYHIGKGKKKNLGQAYSWYEKAAKQNHPVALNNIGVFYEQGLFVGKSAKKASKWYKESAEWGYPYAQYNLGILYHEGRGVKKDPKEAQFWLQIAALQGVSQAVDVLKKISGKVHEGKPELVKKTDDKKGPQWHSSKNANITSENPHTSSAYKNIADRIKSTRSSDTLEPNLGGDFLTLPAEKTKPGKKETPKSKPKPTATTAKPTDNKSNSNAKSVPDSKRVETNFKTGEQFDEWLSDAQVAQQRLNEQKLQMKKTNSHMLEIFNDDWVHSRNKNYYTIQLAKSDELDGLLKMARKQPMLKETAYYTSVEDGKKWYNLVYGNFKDKKSATAEIKNLPKTVKQWSPKVRRFSEVHSNMSLDAPKVLINKN
jgi:septal ring-binding cell division protein DamX